MASSPTSTQQQQQQPKKNNIVPLQVQKSIMEWLDEDLPNDSPARVARALGMPSNIFSQQQQTQQHGVARVKGGPTNSSARAAAKTGTTTTDQASTVAGGGGAASTATGNSPTRKRFKGTLRQRQKEHTHVFVEDPSLPAVHPANSIWLYGSYEYKLQTPPEEAQRSVFRIISRLVDRMQRMLDASTAAVARGDQSKEAMSNAEANAVIDAMMPPLPSTVLGTATTTTNGNKNNNHPFSVNIGTGNGVLPANHPLQGAVTGGRFRAKGHLVFDLISTRKHITQNFRNGLPYRLGEEIYEHCQRKYVDCIATCFVGLTDNPAQRVGRDIFYQKSDDLSTSHLSFMNIDYGHLFVVFPPDSKRLRESNQQIAEMFGSATTMTTHNNNTGFRSGSRGRNNNNNNNNNNAQQDPSNATEYDENNTRFLADALSGAHDLTGSTIPGRPPPIASLAHTRRQQEEAMMQVQQLRAEKVQQQRAASSGSQNRNQSPILGGNNNNNSTTGNAAQLIALHRQMFSNSPRGRQVQVKGSTTTKTKMYSNSESPTRRDGSADGRR